MEEPRVERILHPPGETIEERVNRLYRENKILGDLAHDLAVIMGAGNSSPEALRERAKTISDRAALLETVPRRVARQMRDRVAHILDVKREFALKKEIMREVRDIGKQTDWSEGQ